MTTRVVNIREAKSRLSELIREAEAGVEVIMAMFDGHPVAKIVPWCPGRPARVAGAWTGRVGYRGDVVSSDAETAAMFDGSRHTLTG